MVDDHEILYRRNLTRLIERPVRVQQGPILRPEHPWEGDGVHLWGSVYREADLYRMWYLGISRGHAKLESSICLATSSDGLTWTRALANQWPFDGQRPTNIVIRDHRDPQLKGMHPFTVIKDPLDPDPARRYKFLSWITVARRKHGYMTAYSADGVQWTLGPRQVIPRGDRTSVMQDFIRGGFVMASRGDHRSRDRLAGHRPKRDVAVSRSLDFEHWSSGIRIIEADDDDPPDLEFYGMPMFVWGNQYLGLLEAYDPVNELLNVQLATSRDGDTWERACSRRTYFDVGSSDRWDSTWVAFGMTPPVVVGDEMLFWYTGRPMAHRRPKRNGLVSAIGAARAPRDRFAGLRAGPDGGELTSDWVEIGGPRLLMNIGAASNAVSIAVTGQEGQPLEGFGHDECDLAIANGVDVEATWRGRNVASLVGHRTRLHIHIRYGTLYAYRFASREPSHGE